jgi:acyl-CoA thioester hydrolase
VSKKDFQFYHPFRIRYSEIDGQKVVFNAHYLTYFDTAITEYFRWLPFDYVNHFDQTGHDFHTARTLIDYKAPIRFDEEIEVFVRTARVGRSSLSFALSIYGKDEDQPRATGEVVWVYINLETGKSAPVYPDLLALLHKREEGTP